MLSIFFWNIFSRGEKSRSWGAAWNNSPLPPPLRGGDALTVEYSKCNERVTVRVKI